MTVLYKKEGRKYIPIGEYDPEMHDHMPYGVHLTVVSKGGWTSRKYNVNAEMALLIGAMHFARDRMAKVVYNAGQARPSKPPVTPAQRDAWDHFQTLMGDELKMVHYPSSVEVVDAGIEALLVETKHMLDNPVVKKAFDQFLMLYELTSKQTEET